MYCVPNPCPDLLCLNILNTEYFVLAFTTFYFFIIDLFCIVVTMFMPEFYSYNIYHPSPEHISCHQCPNFLYPLSPPAFLADILLLSMSLSLISFPFITGVCNIINEGALCISFYPFQHLVISFSN